MNILLSGGFRSWFLGYPIGSICVLDDTNVFFVKNEELDLERFVLLFFTNQKHIKREAHSIIEVSCFRNTLE